MKTLIVDKVISDKKMERLTNTFVTPSQINTIVNEDADVYTKEGKLLLKFRKKKLNADKINDFYNATFKHTSTHPSKIEEAHQAVKQKVLKITHQ